MHFTEIICSLGAVSKQWPIPSCLVPGCARCALKYGSINGDAFLQMPVGNPGEWNASLHAIHKHTSLQQGNLNVLFGLCQYTWVNAMSSWQQQHLVFMIIEQKVCKHGNQAYFIYTLQRNCSWVDTSKKTAERQRDVEPQDHWGTQFSGSLLQTRGNYVMLLNFLELLLNKEMFLLKSQQQHLLIQNRQQKQKDL